MSYPARASVRLLLSFLLILAAPLGWAQTYPAKSVRMVVDMAPGGISDILARLSAESLTQQFGNPVVVENRAGATGAIGIDYVIKSAPDGYTLIFAAGGDLVVQPFLVAKLPFDPLADVIPVFQLCETPHLLVVPSTLPVKTLADFITYAKASPGKLSYGTPGIGTPPHFSMDQIARLAGLELVHVPYKGGASIMPDLVSGRLHVVSLSLGSVRPHLKSGALRALATGTTKRLSALPDVPTSAEAGLPAWQMTAWFGLFAPKGTDADIVRVLNERMQTFLDDPKTRQKLSDVGAEPLGGSATAFAERMRADYSHWGRVVKDSGIKLQ